MRAFDYLHNETVRRSTRYQRRTSVPTLFRQTCGVEPKSSLLLRSAMASVAVLAENGFDVPEVVRLGRSRRRSPERRFGGESCGDEEDESSLELHRRIFGRLIPAILYARAIKSRVLTTRNAGLETPNSRGESPIVR